VTLSFRFMKGEVRFESRDYQLENVP